MTKRELAYILERRKWPGYWQYPSARGGRFAFLFMLLPTLFFLILVIAKDIQPKNNGSIDSLGSVLIIGIFEATLVMTFVRNIKSQAQFTEVKTARCYSAKEILNIAHKLDWTGNSSKNNNTVELITSKTSFFRLRQRITIIILNDHRLLFNSYSLSELIIINRNRDNLKKLLAKIN